MPTHDIDNDGTRREHRRRMLVTRFSNSSSFSATIDTARGERGVNTQSYGEGRLHGSGRSSSAG